MAKESKRGGAEGRKGLNHRISFLSVHFLLDKLATNFNMVKRGLSKG